LSRIASGIGLALLAVAAVPAAAPAALGALLAGVAHVGQQRDLARTLDRGRELVLVAQAPLIRRERILPRSDTKRRRVATSL
jgi:hypothetical protein